MMDTTITKYSPNSRQSTHRQVVRATLDDCEAVITLFGALHTYNASLDTHFALSDDWEAILRDQFCISYDDPDMLWLLVKDGDDAVGLLIAGVHIDSPLFKHRHWVEVQALYVASSHRRMGIARQLLDYAYAWTEAHSLKRVQLYVTASNMRAQIMYDEEGFERTQFIMRKKLI